MKQKARIYKIQAPSQKILLHGPIALGGQEATQTNRSLILQCWDAWTLIPLDLVGACIDEQYITDCYVKIARILITRDFNDVLDTLEFVYRYLIKGTCKRFSQFKADISEYPLARTLISPVIGLIKRFIEQEDTSYLTVIVSWLRFPSKLTFKMENLEARALESFLESETRLRSIDWTGIDFLLDDLNAILKGWLKNLDLEFLPVRHGSGSVAEGNLSMADKYRSLVYDEKIDYCCRWMNSGLTMSHYCPFAPDSTHKLDRVSVVRFVPKNAKKLRTICMEPATLQYFQQGVMRVTYEYFRKHPYLSNRIRLQDQTWNQELARDGSIGNGLATLDLSAASDSVSWVLVRRIFKGTPLLRWMIATRSTHNRLPDGSVIESAKFAPMGSALCFPTECLVFAAIIEYVARKCGNRPSDTRRVWSVYGDDLIVPADWVDPIILILNRLGFIVNSDKSYTDGPFRESCGKEYYRGVDVTPTYYRLPVIKESLSPSDFMALSVAANNSWQHRFLFLRAYYIDKILTTPKKSPISKFRNGKPLFAEDCEHPPFIYSKMCTNFHLKVVANEDWQREEYEFLSVTSADEYKDSVIYGDHLRYLQFLIEREFHPGNLDEINLIESYPWSDVPRRPKWFIGRHPVA